jgi:hypothetical protein
MNLYAPTGPAHAFCPKGSRQNRPQIPNGPDGAKSRPKTAPCGWHRDLRFSSELSRLPVRIYEGDDLFEPRDYVTGLQELLLFIDLR